MVSSIYKRERTSTLFSVLPNSRLGKRKLGHAPNHNIVSVITSQASLGYSQEDRRESKLQIIYTVSIRWNSVVHWPYAGGGISSWSR